MKLTREVIIANKGQCRLCNDIIESHHRHDYVTCKCGEVSVDGGKSYMKRSAKDFANFIELSEFTTEEYDAQF